MTIGQIRGGLAGKILKVDLSTRKIQAEETEAYAKEFIGGRAINSFILFNNEPRDGIITIGSNCSLFSRSSMQSNPLCPPPIISPE